MAEVALCHLVNPKTTIVAVASRLTGNEDTPGLIGLPSLTR